MKRFTILRRLHRNEVFESASDREDFELKLRDLIEKGVVEAIPVKKHRSSIDEEAWFRDKRTGAVYRYVPPDPPSPGYWGPVEKPEQPSFLENLCPNMYPTTEQFRTLIGSLDRAWKAGEIECAYPPKPDPEVVWAYIHHIDSGEIFSLSMPTSFSRGTWAKTFRSKERGSWPGDLVPGTPPWVKKE